MIRSKRPLSDEELRQISAQFKDLCFKGSIERLKDLSEDDNQDLSLERLVFHFNRTSYSRLRELIDHINALPALS